MPVANDLVVRVLAEDPSWLDVLPPATEAERVAATLRVTRGGVATDSRRAIAFEAELRWMSGDRARFRVPCGHGELSLSGAQADAHLALAAGHEAIAVGTTLRMLLGLLLPAHGGLLVHASAVALHGRAYVFLGASGAGKTTTARRLVGEGASLVAEDLLVLRTAEPARAEACRFDYSFPREAAVGAVYPVAGAYLVYKGAPSTVVCAPHAPPLQAWSSAIFSPLVGAALMNEFMESLGAVQRIPLRGLLAAPEGPIRPALECPGGERDE